MKEKRKKSLEEAILVGNIVSKETVGKTMIGILFALTVGVGIPLVERTRGEVEGAR